MVFIFQFVNMIYHTDWFPCVSIEIIIWFSSFNLLIWYITLIDFHILKNLCIPGIKLSWLWYVTLFMLCWILISKLLLDVCIYVHQWYCSVIFYSCGIFGFDISVMVASWNGLGRFPSSAMFLKSLSMKPVRSFGSICLKPSGPGLLFFERLLL